MAMGLFHLRLVQGVSLVGLHLYLSGWEFLTWAYRAFWGSFVHLYGMGLYYGFGGFALEEEKVVIGGVWGERRLLRLLPGGGYFIGVYFFMRGHFDSSISFSCVYTVHLSQSLLVLHSDDSEFLCTDLSTVLIEDIDEYRILIIFFWDIIVSAL